MCIIEMAFSEGGIAIVAKSSFTPGGHLVRSEVLDGIVSGGRGGIAGMVAGGAIGRMAAVKNKENRTRTWSHYIYLQPV